MQLKMKTDRTGPFRGEALTSQLTVKRRAWSGEVTSVTRKLAVSAAIAGLLDGHGGIDWHRVAGAVLANLRSGALEQGFSTNYHAAGQERLPGGAAWTRGHAPAEAPRARGARDRTPPFVYAAALAHGLALSQLLDDGPLTLTMPGAPHGHHGMPTRHIASHSGSPSRAHGARRAACSS
jgi:hypothetical protein